MVFVDVRKQAALGLADDYGMDEYDLFDRFTYEESKSRFKGDDSNSRQIPVKDRQ